MAWHSYGDISSPSYPHHAGIYIYTHICIFSLKTVEVNYLTGAGCEMAGVRFLRVVRKVKVLPGNIPFQAL